MNSNDNTHGPPDDPRTFDDDEVRLPFRQGTIQEVAHLAAERALMLASPGYRLLTAELRARGEGIEAMDLVMLMATGRYRQLRNPDNTLAVDEQGEPQADYMSFRTISAELHRLTGEDVSHETLRRWWARVWPTVPVPDLSFRQATRQAATRLRNRRTPVPPPVGPDVPGAPGIPGVVFMPPDAA